MPELSFDIVGRDPDQRLQQRAAANPDIHLHGFVDDLEEFHQRCRVFVVPLLFGSGMKVKVLHGLYRGLPMVTTDIGAEGIAMQDGTHGHIAPKGDAGTFSDMVVQLMTNREEWEAMRDASRTLARTMYTWEQHLSALEAHLAELLG